MMNWILVIMGAIVAIVLALIVGGLAAARTRLVAREIQLRAPLDAVWPLVKAAEQTPSWCPELPNMTMTSETPPRLVQLQLLDDSGDPFGEWTVTLSTRAGGTQLSIAETSEVRNPITRFIGSFSSFGFDTQRVDGFLLALAGQLGEADIVVGPGTSHPHASSPS